MAVYTLYSPNLVETSRGVRNVVIPAADLKRQLLDFYSVYNPKRTQPHHIDDYLLYAAKRGVLALKRNIKQKYGCNFDEVDSTVSGWQLIYQQLRFYCEAHGNEMKKDLSVENYFAFAKTEGLFELDNKLKQLYNESLTEFAARGMNRWKQNWKTIIKQIHSDRVSYELERFYNVVDATENSQSYSKLARMKNSKAKSDLEELVHWQLTHTRDEVNEKLLEKYNFCLDDVKMIKGATHQERKVNLQTQLIEFYQKYNPSYLTGGSVNESNSNLRKEQSFKDFRSFAREYSLDSSNVGSPNSKDGRERAFLEQLDREASEGVVRLEQLNARLFAQYHANLQTLQRDLVKDRLTRFYQERNVAKTEKNIDDIVSYGFERGFVDMNEKLFVAYGVGIEIDDLED